MRAVRVDVEIHPCRPLQEKAREAASVVFSVLVVGSCAGRAAHSQEIDI
jgi:hypothetical protein